MDVRLGGGFAPCILLRARNSAWTFAGALLIACLCLLLPLRLSAQSSICAEVKIEIDQKVSLERQAFEAVLKIRNGLEGVQVERIDVNLVFKDLGGGEASALFYNRLDTVSGIAGSVEDGSGVVAASTTGEAHWLIIPSQGAGGTQPQGKNYQVGATITYRMTGETTDRTVEVIPEIITVRPQPLLDLDYFLPSYVYGDDPLTETVDESIVPFTLGVRITNNGAGVASHTTIESAQPVIRENPQGLLIGFQIVGSYVDDQPSQPSLLIDFGDIDPGQSRIGRWLMTTTLAGRFFGFDAEYTHADDLGGALTSLLGTITPYQLTHDVLVDLPGRDSVRDFLAQAVDAQDTDTYRVYESDGSVSDAVVQKFDLPPFSGTALSFSSQAQGLLVYARASMGQNDPGQAIYAIRSDGKVVPPGNVWFSKRRNANADGWLYFVNLFEANSSSCGSGTCTYNLSYDGAPSEASLAGVVYEDVNANGVQDAGEQGLAGVTVVLSGGSGPQSIGTASDGSFQFANLTAGTYALNVGSVAGHDDGSVTIGSGGGTASGSSVNGIVLDAGTQASGYLFAKVPTPVQRGADLAITGLAASTTSPREGEAFTLTLQIANAGPDTAGVDAGLTLPSTIEVLSANPSAGTFDATIGHWAVGNLSASGSASLSLQVRATSEGDPSITASVSSTDASILDPNTGNNLSSLALHVRPATEVSVTPSFAREARVLALVSCSRLSSGADLSCEPNRTSALDGYLASRSVEHLVTSSGTVFRDELRSGRWNVYWIDNGAFKVDDSVLSEVGLAVLRGDSLIVDGAHDTGSATLESWAGVSYIGLRSSTAAEAVTFLPNDYLNFSGLIVSGKKYTYQVTSAAALATYPDNVPAVMLGMHGSGRVLVFSFDLVTILGGNATYAPLFDQIATAVKPVIPAFFMADAYVPVNVSLSNDGEAITIDEALSVPAGARIVTATPAPSSQTDQQVVWRKSVDSPSKFVSSVGIRTMSSGTSPISIDVTQIGGDGANLAHQELALPVYRTDKHGQTVLDDISALLVSGSTDTGLRSTAGTQLQTALNARSKGDPNGMIANLLAADTTLMQIVSADTTPVRIGLGWLLQAFEREWYVALSTCSAASAPPIVDSGISFAPFAANEGLYLHQINPGGFEWRLGADTQSTTASVGATTALTNSQTYQWTLSYDNSGNGTLAVKNGATTLASLTYTVSSTQLLHRGNGLRLYVEALAGSGSANITVAVNSLEGTTLSNTIAASATTAAANASLYYYEEALKDGFAAGGTVNVVVPRVTGSNPPPRLSFLVNAGSLSCKNTSR